MRRSVEPADPTGLKLAVEDAKRLGKIEEDLASNREEILKHGKEAAGGIGALGFGAGPLEDIERLPVPDAETINDFDSRIRDAKAEVQKHESEIERIEDELLKIRRDLDQLRIEGDVPTEDDLARARQKRDDGWQLIRGLVEGGAGSAARRGWAPFRAGGARTALPGILKRICMPPTRLRTGSGARRTGWRGIASLLSDRENRDAQIERVRTKKDAAEAELAGGKCGMDPVMGRGRGLSGFTGPDAQVGGKAQKALGNPGEETRTRAEGRFAFRPP